MCFLASSLGFGRANACSPLRLMRPSAPRLKRDRCLLEKRLGPRPSSLAFHILRQQGLGMTHTPFGFRRLGHTQLCKLFELRTDHFVRTPNDLTNFISHARSD